MTVPLEIEMNHRWFPRVKGMKWAEIRLSKNPTFFSFQHCEYPTWANKKSFVGFTKKKSWVSQQKSVRVHTNFVIRESLFFFSYCLAFISTIPAVPSHGLFYIYHRWNFFFLRISGILCILTLPFSRCLKIRYVGSSANFLSFILYFIVIRYSINQIFKRVKYG